MGTKSCLFAPLFIIYPAEGDFSVVDLFFPASSAHQLQSFTSQPPGSCLALRHFVLERDNIIVTFIPSSILSSPLAALHVGYASC